MTIETIQRDLSRTFPQHILFRGAEGQEQLFNVLKAYSLYDTEIGYCQSMSFITAFMLMYMTEEESFLMLIGFMQNCAGRRFYLTGMP